MRYTALFIAAILFAIASAAQQQPASTADAVDFRAEGLVVNAETGQPIANAHLQVGGGPVCGARTAGIAVSGDDGSFRIPLKTSGPYIACVWRDGYVTDSPLRLKQCSPCTATIRLHAASTVDGRVVSAETKDPVGDVVVEAIRVTDSFNIATSVTSASARTFPDGRFSLEQLVPGQYFFRFIPASTTPLIVNDGRDPEAREFATQWWPGGDSPSNTTPFTILAGTRFRLPDVWLPAVPRFQVSGTVEPTICRQGVAYNVSIGEHRGASVAMIRSMLVRCGAEFTFGDLTPGRYEISLLAKDGGDPVAREEAVVTDRDLQRDFPASRATP